MDNVINRNRLGFEKAVKEYFAFLVDEYGYMCILSNLNIVKYTSDKVYFNVYHEKISYEIYFEIGLLPEDCNSQLNVTISDIVETAGLVNEEIYYQVSNNKDINLIVKKLASLVKTHAKEALKGSFDYFKEVSEIRYKRQQHALLIQEIKTAEEKAKKAWDVKDYKTVVKIYSQYEKDLSIVQIKMLEYAKKKVSRNIMN